MMESGANCDSANCLKNTNKCEDNNFEHDLEPRAMAKFMNDAFDSGHDDGTRISRGGHDKNQCVCISGTTRDNSASGQDLPPTVTVLDSDGEVSDCGISFSCRSDKQEVGSAYRHVDGPHSLDSSLDRTLSRLGSHFRNCKNIVSSRDEMNSLHRPRSCSSTLEALVPLAMMTPLLVASSPLARSTPSLQLLHHCTTDLSSVLPNSHYQNKLGHNNALPIWQVTATDCHQLDGNSSDPKLTNVVSSPGSSLPLSVPKNPFRRSSLQITKCGAGDLEKDTKSALDDTAMQSKPRRKVHSFSSKASIDVDSRLGYWRRHSAFGEIFQGKSRGGSPLGMNAPVPSVAVVPPMQVCLQDGVYRLENSLD